ncbi:MAG TPA: hypothetical protein VGP94_16895 [Tepidisphaeraceae bacterium]|nr:hypothetical protein [Tepidisphaeraceae bacterium]
MLRKDPQKTAGFLVLAILGIGSLILYAAYLRHPPAPTPTFSLQPPRPTTRPTTNRSELLEDSRIIQANSLQLEQRRLALDQLRAARALSSGRPNPGRRPPPAERSALERLFRPRPSAPAIAAPTTSPTTQVSR